MKFVHVISVRQRGAVLVVGLIMLVLITLLVTSAFTLSSTSIKAVGNMQFRDEAVAAANKAIEQVLSSPFTTSPAAEEILVDINNDGSDDYKVEFEAPTCISANQVASASIPPSSVSLGSAFASAASEQYQTIWELDATVEDINHSGASVHVHQGVRTLLNQTEYNAVCT